MLAIVTKFFFVYYFTYYISCKIMKLIPTMYFKLCCCMLSLIASVMTYFLGIYLVEIKYILPLIIIWISISIYSAKPQVSFVACTISYGISYSVHAISSFIICFIAFLFYGTSPSLSYFLIAVLSSILQILFILHLFHTKRFKNGMSFLLTTSAINIATILCLVFVMLLIYICINESFRLGFLASTFILAFLIYWWQAQITKSYRRSLELRELESLRTELAEKNADIQKIMKENERVRFINHRDNNLLSAMEYSVNNYLVTDFTDKETAIAKRDELLQELNKIRGNRASSYHNQETEVVTFNTGSSLLNTLLIHMNREAAKDNILFTVHQSTELDNFIPREISEEDLVHLVDDLLKNAFIAVKDFEVRMVQLQFYKWNKHLVVEVSDNGIPFEVKSIVNMGITELTTHADTGGSGIGLVDIWNTKEKCKATYHMEEYATSAPFSKKISLTFDKKNRYSVRTWRKDEILQMSKRADLQVYGE